MPQIFLSYRRDDNRAMVDRVYAELRSQFGADNVFRDIDDIIAGEDFPDKLRQALDRATVVLVAIGDKWLDIRGAAGERRLDDPGDWVRLEVAAALNRPGARVIPLLLEKASMPTAADLPGPLQRLVFRNAERMRADPDFSGDIRKLILTLGGWNWRRWLRAAIVALVAFAFMLAIMVTAYMVYGYRRVHEVEQRIVVSANWPDIRRVIENASPTLRTGVLPLLRERVSATSGSRLLHEEAIQTAKARSRAAFGLAFLDDKSGLEQVLETPAEPSDPQARAYAIRYAKTAGFTQRELLDLLKHTADPETKQALLLMMGQYYDLDQDQELVASVSDLFCDNDDPAVHAAVLWLLKNKLGERGIAQWKQKHDVLQRQGIQRLLDRMKDGNLTTRHWYVDSRTGITFVCFPPVEGNGFQMGDADQWQLRDLSASRGDDQLSPRPHNKSIPRAFAVSMTEVTEAQYLLAGESDDIESPALPETDFARRHVSWNFAARFCNWMSQPGDECYDLRPVNPVQKHRMLPECEHLKRGGYRLPTEAEWEFACRGWSSAPYCYGRDPDLLPDYASWKGTLGKAIELLPNGFGLFDVHGSVAEWCDDNPTAYPHLAAGETREDWGSTAADENLADRILRGGSYLNDDSEELSCFKRSKLPQRNSNQYTGFRVATTLYVSE